MKMRKKAPLGRLSSFKNAALVFFSSCLALSSAHLYAQNQDGMTVDIVGFATQRIPILIQPQANPAFDQLLQNYLLQSGKIQPSFQAAPYTLRYRVQGNQLDATFIHTQEQKQINFSLRSEQPHLMAQRLADFVYERLFNRKGVFSTRLSYVIQTRDAHQLMIADSDGKNAKVALRSRQPIISVSWSPDGKKVAYVSFERDKPTIFIHDLATGQRQEIANYMGNNSAPAWHPKEPRLALALSLDGHTQIYELDVNTKALRRLSYSIAPIIDTEPVYSPDGQMIYFTSDRAGSAQIYRMSAYGEKTQPAQRLTFLEGENTSVRVSPDQQDIVFIRHYQGRQLYRQNLQTAQTQKISQTFHDENPSFAANGDYVVYATLVNGRRVLIASDLQGQAHHQITHAYGAIKQPAWGPFND